MATGLEKVSFHSNPKEKQSKESSNYGTIALISQEFQKNIYFCFIDYAIAFDCVDHTNYGKFFKRWKYHTTWPASWETCMQVKKQQLELNMEHNWFKIGKGVRQGCILLLCLFNLYAEYIRWNAELDEA